MNAMKRKLAKKEKKLKIKEENIKAEMKAMKNKLDELSLEMKLTRERILESDRLLIYQNEVMEKLKMENNRLKAEIKFNKNKAGLLRKERTLSFANGVTSTIITENGKFNIEMDGGDFESSSIGIRKDMTDVQCDIVLKKLTLLYGEFEIIK